MVHLTFTGFDAGKLLCNIPRNEHEQTLVHAVYAPLDKPEFRANCCQECLKVWAQYAYDEGEDMPDYIKELR